MIRSLALPLIALFLCLSTHAADEGYLRIRDGAPKRFVHYKLDAGELVRPDQHFKEAKNIGHNDLLLTIKDDEGAVSTVRLVRKRNATIVIPRTKFNHLLVGVECLDLATYQDASNLLSQFASSKREIIRQPSQAAEAAVLKARAKAIAKFDEFRTNRQQLDAKNALAEIEASWAAIQKDALKVRSKLSLTIEGDFPELHRAITTTESLSFPVSDTAASVKSLQRLRKQLASLSETVNKPKEERPAYVVNLETDYPEVHAISGVKLGTSATDTAEYLKSLQRLSAELQSMDRKYKAGSATAVKVDPDGYAKAQSALKARPNLKQLSALSKGLGKDVAASRAYVESINASSITLTEEGFEDAQKPFLKQVAGLDTPLKALAAAIEKVAAAHGAVKTASEDLNTALDTNSVKSLASLSQADFAGRLTDKNREFDAVPVLASIKEITGKVSSLTKELSGAGGGKNELSRAVEAVSSQAALLRASAKELKVRQSEVPTLIKRLQRSPRLSTPDIDGTSAGLSAYSAALDAAGGAVRSNIIAVAAHSKKATSGNTIPAEIKTRIKKASGAARVVMQSLAGPRNATKAVQAATRRFEKASAQLSSALSASPASAKYRANTSRAAGNLSVAAKALASSSASLQKADDSVTRNSSSLALDLGALNTALNSNLSQLPNDLLALLASIPAAMSKTVQAQNIIGKMTFLDRTARMANEASTSVSNRVEEVIEKAGLNRKEVNFVPVQKAVAEASKQLETLSYSEWSAQATSVSRAAEKMKAASDQAAASVFPFPLTTADKAKSAAEASNALNGLLSQASTAAKALNQKQNAAAASLKALQQAMSVAGLGGEDLVLPTTDLDGWDQAASEALPVEKQWQNVAASNAKRMKQAGERAGVLLADRLEKEIEEGIAVMRKEVDKVEECLKTAVANRDEIAEYQVEHAVNVAVDGIHPEALTAYGEVRSLLTLDDAALKRAAQVLKRGRNAIKWNYGAPERAVATFESDTSKLQAEMKKASDCVWAHKTAATNKASELRALIRKTQALVARGEKEGREKP
jgi:hypothetical protein